MYVKNVELCRFKSFGATTAIPLLPGFTVVSGPNGSGKSNILDALLFALGLAGSKGMRADRLPDLVNQAHAKKGRTVETSVTVTFALDDHELALLKQDDDVFQLTAPNSAPTSRDDVQGEWVVSRKLRVTQQGTYTSTYYMNGTPCTLSELHEQLSKVRIYPEGYNVVLQGDVTGIISMNGRERREIIDELAGVGEFDRKINTAKNKLDEVKDQEEKFRIVEQELVLNQERLQVDSLKAKKYQALKDELAVYQSAEAVVVHRNLLYQQSIKQIELQNCRDQAQTLAKQMEDLSQNIEAATVQLNELSTKVHTLGEEDFLATSTQIAERQAELRALQRRQQDLGQIYQNTQNQINFTQEEIDRLLRERDNLNYQKQQQDAAVITLQKTRDQQSHIVATYRKEVQSLAGASAVWLREQSTLRQEIDRIQQNLDPKKQEQTRLQESLRQWQMQLHQYQTELTQVQLGTGRYSLDTAEQSLEDLLAAQQIEVNKTEALVQTLAKNFSEAQSDVQLQQETIDRLTQEQQVKNRQLDKLEAHAQANREFQGTRASQLIIEAGVMGVYGLVAQLGMVEPRYQTALEIAAGGRMGHLVVENDEVAAEAIQLLKLQRGGRATFLPMNKLKEPQTLLRQQANELGAVDYAVNLITFEDRYAPVFAFVFGNTLVFDRLDRARQHLGKHRMVTLEGELLETSGAMTGGSTTISSGALHFGKNTNKESAEIKELRDRLLEIDQMLTRLQQRLDVANSGVAKYEAQLQQARTNHREAVRQYERLHEQLHRNTKEQERLQEQITQLSGNINHSSQQLESLEKIITELEAELYAKRQELTELEQSSRNVRWQQAQENLQTQDALLNNLEIEYRALKQQITEIDNQLLLTLEKISQKQSLLQSLRAQQAEQINASAGNQLQIKEIEDDLASLQNKLEQFEQILGAAKQERDACERSLMAYQQQSQQTDWQLQKNGEKQAEIEMQLLKLETEIKEIELPDPLPDIPEGMTPEQLQHEQRRLQKRIQAMEPINMTAHIEYEAIGARLAELSGRLETLYQERTELLLRIENFTTLRQRAFMQAFDAVNQHFKEIFAELSDGDGYLQLENTQNPLSGGLNLVAHPKGKQVQHLASMSGGEKSLTALSFIFALQRYRPSPFYAFDEVDMFLDGANVERLSKMVRKQAQLAQFIVVSLRRPMIEASERTIGVTQARGAHTQVLGLELGTAK